MPLELSEETGRNHRLPTEKEIGSIQKLADASENNLDYWAGYAPTPDE